MREFYYICNNITSLREISIAAGVTQTILSLTTHFYDLIFFRLTTSRGEKRLRALRAIRVLQINEPLTIANNRKLNAVTLKVRG